MAYKYEFEVDAASKTISFAGVQFKKFQLLNKLSEVYSVTQFARKDFKVIQAREFSDTYHITPSKFKRVFNAIMMRVWVDPVVEHVNRFAYNSQRKIDAYKIDLIWESIEQIEQAKKDGIHNIVPWIIYHRKSPKDLKQTLGKSLWKQVTKQSMTRNKFLAGISKNHYLYSGLISQVKVAAEMPSWLLKRGRNSGFEWNDTTKWLLKNNLLTSKIIEVGRGRGDAFLWRDKYDDTKMMCARLGLVFNPEWPVEKVNEKHEECVKLTNLKKYSPTPYPVLNNMDKQEIQHKGFTVKLLDNAADIKTEGEEMHHCVGGYTGSVAEGKYLVYSIRKDGKRRSSTIAFRKELSDHTQRRKEKWVFSQHYGHCNAHVTDSDEIEIKDLFLKQLNSSK